MLTALHIQDFVLIDQARLTLTPGLTALTGETGAGKSILLDALGLAIGGRAERGMVREGAEQGVVAATFEERADHPVWEFLEENGLGGDEDQIILRRVQGKDGRGRGFVNDQPVSIRMLRDVGEKLLEIHGQHDGRGFLTASTHRNMLDEFGGLVGDAGAVAKLWRALRDIEVTLDDRRRERDATAREADYLRFVESILDKLAPQPGEDTALAERRAALMACEKITEDLNDAVKPFYEGGIEDKLSISLRSIERAAARLSDDTNSLTTASRHLEAALHEAMEARGQLEKAVGEYGGDPDELDQTEERLFALRAEARKHGVAPDTLSEFHAKTKAALADLEQGAATFTELERELAAARVKYERAASALTRARIKASAMLDLAVAKELKPLKLGKALFQTKIDTDTSRLASDGFDHVEFMVATNPGAPAGPLKTIASGGELSRFVLAMKAALAAKENRTVIIFDEVDAGVGGAVADAVGERLARLARDAQVLVVTHSPQVAARASAHWRIEKTQTKTKTTTRVATLSPEDRIEEIARMLSGATISDEARAAAEKLLGGVKPQRRSKTRKRA
ncbi:MAG: DNA repair protein RecN [Alphaproteobacteria bacterium]|nr:DNA repair protein RecN [Alphaproteobacteria bacterium]